MNFHYYGLVMLLTIGLYIQYIKTCKASGWRQVEYGGSKGSLFIFRPYYMPTSKYQKKDIHPISAKENDYWLCRKQY